MNAETTTNKKYPYQDLFCVRTITCFVNLFNEDFVLDNGNNSNIKTKIDICASFLKQARLTISNEGYTVQTIRIVTNPFPTWIGDKKETVHERLQILDELLQENDISFCSLGPASTIEQVKDICEQIVQYSIRFSCSATLQQNDINMAKQCAKTIISLSKLSGGEHIDNGLGNFRFCVASYAKDYIPFFPIAKSGIFNNQNYDSNNIIKIKFAIGLENGALAYKLLSDCKSIVNISTIFANGMKNALQPLQDICKQIAMSTMSLTTIKEIEFLGIDTSLNPSLEHINGSVAASIEQLDEIQYFGGPGTLAAASAITQMLQSIPGHCGYSGLMLPVCEDKRLAELTNNNNNNDDRQISTASSTTTTTSSSSLQITQLLSISQVCGVGIDTVPIPGNCSISDLMGLLLDVAGIAGRWNKSLSCRVFPVPNKTSGEWTEFDNSPYMVNACILPLT